MDALLQPFNKLGACDFQYEKLSSLRLNHPYKLLSIEAQNTQFGRRVTVLLEGIDGVIFLPERFKNLTDEEIQLFKIESRLHLLYKGKKQLLHGRTAHEVELIQL